MGSKRGSSAVDILPTLVIIPIKVITVRTIRKTMIAVLFSGLLESSLIGRFCFRNLQTTIRATYETIFGGDGRGMYFVLRLNGGRVALLPNLNEILQEAVGISGAQPAEHSILRPVLVPIKVLLRCEKSW